MRYTTFCALAGATLSLCLLPVPAHSQDEAVVAERVETDRFSVEVSGEGPDVILIPGMATPRQVWDANVPKLAAGHRVHALQVAGFGQEAGPNAEGPVLDPLIDQLARYIRQRGLERPAIVGHSLGGLIAMRLAAKHPDLAGRIMVVDALPWFGILMIPPGTPADASAVENRAEALRTAILARHENPASLSQVQAELAGQVLDPAKLTRVAQWAAQADQRVVSRLVYEDINADMRQAIADITVPVTVAFSWNDRFPTRDQATQFYASQYAALDGITFRPVGPAGHFLMLDQPAAFQAVLDEFLAVQVTPQ